MPRLTSPLPLPTSTGPSRDAGVALAEAALQLDTVGSLPGLLALQDEWTALFDRCLDTATVFQRFEWAWQCASASTRNSALYVLTARRAGRLVAVAPLALNRRFGASSLQWLGGGLAIYGDVLADLDVDVAAWMQQALGAASRRRDAQVLLLDNVRADARIAPFLADAGRPHASLEAPWLDMAAIGSFESWRQSLSRSTRRGRSRRLRDLQTLGEVSFEFAPGSAAASPRIARLFEMKRAWMQARSVLSRTLDDADFESLVTGLATGLASGLASDRGGIDCRISTLLLDGMPIAIEIGFVNGRRYLSYIGAYDPAYADYSPGALQLERTLEACFAEGIGVFDLLPPNDAYKAGWSTASAAISSHAVALTAMGVVHQKLARVDVVALAKAGLRHVPAPCRRALQRVLRRPSQPVAAVDGPGLQPALQPSSLSAQQHAHGHDPRLASPAGDGAPAGLQILLRSARTTALRMLQVCLLAFAAWMVISE